MPLGSNWDAFFYWGIGTRLERVRRQPVSSLQWAARQGRAIVECLRECHQVTEAGLLARYSLCTEYMAIPSMATSLAGCQKREGGCKDQSSIHERRRDGGRTAIQAPGRDPSEFPREADCGGSGGQVEKSVRGSVRGPIGGVWRTFAVCETACCYAGGVRLRCHTV